MSRQSQLAEFLTRVPVLLIPLHAQAEDNRGLSERLLRRRLERQGWTVWRGGSVGIESTYPNVQRKYAMLRDLLEARENGLADRLAYICSVHHGMPDLLCHRWGAWKFVECKFRHEQLSDRQKRCIAKLQTMGFPVELHVLVHGETKARAATLTLETGERAVTERQRRLVLRWRNRPLDDTEPLNTPGAGFRREVRRGTAVERRARMGSRALDRGELPRGGDDLPQGEHAPPAPAQA